MAAASPTNLIHLCASDGYALREAAGRSVRAPSYQETLSALGAVTSGRDRAPMGSAADRLARRTELMELAEEA